jgi:hypothetical protein
MSQMSYVLWKSDALKVSKPSSPAFAYAVIFNEERDMVNWINSWDKDPLPSEHWRSLTIRQTRAPQRDKFVLIFLRHKKGAFPKKLAEDSSLKIYSIQKNKIAPGVSNFEHLHLYFNPLKNLTLIEQLSFYWEYGDLTKTKSMFCNADAAAEQVLFNDLSASRIDDSNSNPDSPSLNQLSEDEDDEAGDDVSTVDEEIKEEVKNNYKTPSKASERIEKIAEKVSSITRSFHKIVKSMEKSAKIIENVLSKSSGKPLSRSKSKRKEYEHTDQDIQEINKTKKPSKKTKITAFNNES